MINISIFSCFVKMLGIIDFCIGIRNIKSAGQSEADVSRYFENIRKIHRKTSPMGSFFGNVLDYNLEIFLEVLIKIS